MSIKMEISPWMQADLVTDGKVLVAIGDSHGHSDLLSSLLDAIEEQTPPHTHVIFLGDLVDRGPDSRGCLDLAARMRSRRSTTYLMGNHEAMLLAALSHFTDCDDWTLGRWAHLWIRNGGGAMRKQLDVDDNGTPAPLSMSMLTQNERSVLENMEIFFRCGNLVFIHAGVSPRCLSPFDDVLDGNVGADFSLDEDAFSQFVAIHPLDVDRDGEHPLWIRHQFLGFFEAIETGPFVIHGHTKIKTDLALIGETYQGIGDIKIRGRRLNLDAGSYATGEIAAAQIQDGRYRIFQAKRDDV